MRQSTRLIVNTLSTFARMIATFVAGLVVVRLLVGTLGVNDYGLLAVLGGTAAMLNLISGVLTGTSQRHLAVEVGREDQRQLQVIFNTSLVLFLALGVLLLLIGWAMAPGLLAVLHIPAGREQAASWVFHLVLIGLAVTTVLTPFRALISAHEALFLLDGFDLVSALLHLVVAIVLVHVPGDKLMVYAALMLPVQCLRPVGVSLLCLARYPDSRPRWGRFSWPELRRIASFAGWLGLHRLGLQFRLQVGLLLIQFFFGAAISASYALALVVARYRQSLTRAILRSVSPAMAAMVGRGDMGSLRQLVLVANKYAAIGTSFFVVPVFLETEEVFRLWLPTTLPAATPLLVRLILIWMSIKVLSRGYGAAMIALGRLAWFVIPVTAMSFATLVLAAIGFHFFGLGPWALPATAIGMNVLIDLFMVGYVGRRVGARYGPWWRLSVLPVLIVLVLAGVPACSLRWVMAPGWQRLVGVVLAYGLVASAATWGLALEAWEKDHLRRVLATGVHLVRARLGPAR